MWRRRQACASWAMRAGAAARERAGWPAASARKAEPRLAAAISAPRFGRQEARRSTRWLAEIGRSSAGRRSMPRRKLASLAGIAEASPYLWDLVRADPDRFSRCLRPTRKRICALIAERDARRHGAQGRSRGDARAAARQGRGRAADRARRHWRRVGGERVTRALTELADAAVGAAVRYLLRGAARGQAQPADPAEPENGSGYVVLAMGKMGAHELNYSSDIDLIVLLRSERAALAPGRRAGAVLRPPHRGLVKLLQERTADGYVFRTDLRLRPDPAATQIAVSTAGGAQLLRKHRAELGARRDDQGARLRRRHGAGEAFLQRARALHLAQVSRLRRDRRRARDEAADPRLSRATARSRSRATTSSSAAAASARSSSSCRPSS